MKGTYAKQIRRSLLAACLVFVAFLFSTSRADAQVSDSDMSLNWMTESEALTALDNSVNLFVLEQSNYTPGSAPWINAANHIQYYKLIMGSIEEGNPVPVSVGMSVLAMNDDKSASSDFIPPATLQQLRFDATDLLTF